MSLGLVLLVAPVALFAVASIPALCVQLALGYWYRPAERLSLEEAWALRFEEHAAERAPVFPG